ncbi:MAG: bifunctional (p)ppGpp synthetase/guanosine-3',5'-bis(diphosphate) 3'-pyrophosphohydrolase [Bacteroidales bacterium]|nr:bifunctional (p)ppGpp synthetase/guanosine-3',5'-bis(diphosphate) 3'-pyrophosphohydrolase [Bacteroidales bacterium]
MEQEEVYNKTAEEEKRLILNKYRQIVRIAKITDPKKKAQMRKAFNFAVDAHKDMRRKSGEPYIMHPLEVAYITAKDIGLKGTSIISALLHDVVEDTDYTVEDIDVMFGSSVANIVDGLTKISGMFVQSESMQAENFRKILLTLADDVRVILIKLADRLHNMRTLDSMPHHKQMKITSETSMLYAPLAHRLGLFSVKSELEDLVLKYQNLAAYNMINAKLSETHADRLKFIKNFIKPIKKKLDKEQIEYTIKFRDKSISSIWNKMQTKKIDFDDIYDLFAIRIILKSEINREKLDCWRTYSVVTENYIPKHDRFRDWISVPKANGYEAVHTTLMSDTGRWVEVQIRTERMDDIAERGFAAHWKYKGSVKTDVGLDDWLTRIRELLQSPDSDALDFLDQFKLNLFSSEIYVFTPNGELKTMSKRSKVIDFAYAIHSEVGNKAIGAKINNQLVPLNKTLKSGDQIEILTSNKQKVKEEWIMWAFTARAKSQIKQALNHQNKDKIEKGKGIVKDLCTNLELNCNEAFSRSFMKFIGTSNSDILYKQFADNKLKKEDIDEFVKFNKEQSGWRRYLSNPFSRKVKTPESTILSDEIQRKLLRKPEGLFLSKKYDKSYTTIAQCCQPIPGDDVIGFIEKDETISIHRTTCQDASDLMSRYGNNVIKVKWRDKGQLQFLTGIKMYGNDTFGMMKEISNVLTGVLEVNIRSFSITTHDNLFEGTASIYVNDSQQLQKIIGELQKINGLEKIYRID